MTACRRSGTATKLARGLRELRDDADTPQYLGLVASGATNPTARVEYALRADELLSEPQVRQIMEYYLAVRMRRYGRAFPSGGTGTGSNEHGTERSMSAPNRRRPTDASAGRRHQGSGRPAAPATAVSTVRSVTRGTGREPAATRDISRARPGPPSTVRVSGTANAGVWGAGVRDLIRGVAGGP